jgi:hypothetical protein
VRFSVRRPSERFPFWGLDNTMMRTTRWPDASNATNNPLKTIARAIGSSGQATSGDTIYLASMPARNEAAATERFQVALALRPHAFVAARVRANTSTGDIDAGGGSTVRFGNAVARGADCVCGGLRSPSTFGPKAV